MIMRNETILMMERTNKVRWGEIEDDGKLDFLLPAKQVIGPDEKGIKKVIEYKFTDEGGKTVKVTTTTRVRKVTITTCVRMGARSKRVAERRSWAKFGDAVNDDDAGGSHLTMVSTEEICLERPTALSGTNPEETKASQELDKPGAVLMICRKCGKKGEHWTARCPENNHSSTDQGEASTWSAPAVTDKAPSYVPPSMRKGVDRIIAVSDMSRRNDQNSVRVTNLSEDTREPDLMDLFGSFGDMTRAYVALDQKTRTSRGLGFVNFVSREDAQRAINKLNGYGYDNLILRVEWATPRPN